MKLLQLMHDLQEIYVQHGNVTVHVNGKSAGSTPEVEHYMAWDRGRRGGGIRAIYLLPEGETTKHGACLTVKELVRVEVPATSKWITE